MFSHEGSHVYMRLFEEYNSGKKSAGWLFRGLKSHTKCVFDVATSDRAYALPCTVSLFRSLLITCEAEWIS